MIRKLTSRFGASAPLLLAGLVLVGVVTAWTLRPGDAVFAAPAVGNNDYFLKIPGITGDSTDSRHQGELVVNSFTWSKDAAGVEHTVPTGSGGGGGAGKVTARAIVFTQNVGKASPLLMLATAEGRHFAEVSLTVRRNGENQVEPIVIKLQDVLISSYQVAGKDGGAPTDEFSLNFEEVEYSYVAQRANGTNEPAVTANWNFKTNSN